MSEPTSTTEPKITILEFDRVGIRVVLMKDQGPAAFWFSSIMADFRNNAVHEAPIYIENKSSSVDPSGWAIGAVVTNTTSEIRDIIAKHCNTCPPIVVHSISKRSTTPTAGQLLDMIVDGTIQSPENGLYKLGEALSSVPERILHILEATSRAIIDGKRQCMETTLSMVYRIVDKMRPEAQQTIVL